MVNLISYENGSKETIQKIYGKGKEFYKLSNHIAEAMDYPPAVPLKNMEHRSFSLTTSKGVVLECDARRIDNIIKISVSVNS